MSHKKRKSQKEPSVTKKRKLEPSQYSVPSICWWDDSTTSVPPSFEQRGRDLLSNLLRLNADVFESEYWLQRPYVNHLTPEERTTVFDNKSHPVHMFRMEDIDSLLHRRKPVPPRFLNDVDVTRYSSVDNKREALADGNPEVDPSKVWSAFRKDGYSVRLVHPQQWHQPLFELCSYLQEYFGFPTGCSSYLTPPGAQGYPPHFDDVEIFVIQLSGCKRWRLYDRSDRDTNLAARVTKEFKQEELGEPFSEFVMRPGDVMYFPRGTVHQAVSCEDTHSLHLTFSTYQKFTWFDLFDKVSWKESNKALLEAKAQTSKWLHTCLPLNIMDLDLVGHATSVAWSKLKHHFTDKEGKGRLPNKLLRILRQKGYLEQAIDSIAKDFYENCLPPVSKSKPVGLPEDFEGTKIRLAGRHCARLVNNNPFATSSLSEWDEVDPDDDQTCSDVQLVFYFNTANGRSFSDSPSPQFEVLPCLASSVLQILRSVEESITIGALRAIQKGGEAKETMLDLLDLMFQYGVVVVDPSQ